MSLKAELYKIEILSSGITPEILFQKNTAEKELKRLKEKRLYNRDPSLNLMFFLNRFLANYLGANKKPFAELGYLNISNSNYSDIEDYLLDEIKKLIEEIEFLNSKELKINTAAVTLFAFALTPVNWLKYIRSIVDKHFNKDLKKLYDFEAIIKHDFEKIMLEIGVDRIWNMSFLKHHNEYVELPLSDDNILLGKILDESPKADSVKTSTIPDKLNLFKFEDYLIMLENLINETKYADQTRFYLNKSPHKLFEFISEILNPSDKIQKIQIKRFINNCFNWNSKYGSLENHGDTITFLDKKNMKSFMGGLWYLTENNIIKTTSKEFFEKIIVDDLKDFNGERLRLSYHNLRKYLSDYRDVFKIEHKNLNTGFFK